MSQLIFSVGTDGHLTELKHSTFENEALFQRLLAEHPSVLGLTTSDDAGLLLIKREQSVPDSEGSGGRWSLDHLFVDAEGVPVLVEVKRASDTRARREVVAQMLDYAANGVAYWPIAEMVAAFEKTVSLQEQNSADVLSKFIGKVRTPSDFWKQVEANLKSGRIRLVFVADIIPKELRRIVEFLNEQMSSAEVLAVEVRQYLSADGVRTLVPSLVGATERARSNKTVATNVTLPSLEDWIQSFEKRYGAAATACVRRLINLFENLKCQVVITRSGDSITFRVPTNTAKYAWPFFIRLSTGNFEISLQNLQSRPNFSTDDARLALLERIKRLPRVSIATEKATGWPAFPVAELQHEDMWAALAEIVSSIAATVK